MPPSMWSTFTSSLANLVMTLVYIAYEILTIKEGIPYVIGGIDWTRGGAWKVPIASVSIVSIYSHISSILTVLGWPFCWNISAIKYVTFLAYRAKGLVASLIRPKWVVFVAFNISLILGSFCTPTSTHICVIIQGYVKIDFSPPIARSLNSQT